MATSLLASNPKELFGISFAHVWCISWKNVTFKKQVCKRENNLLKKINYFYKHGT
jgi:hypothetical protein